VWNLQRRIFFIPPVLSQCCDWWIASAHAMALFWLFLLAGMIIGKLKRYHKFVIIDTTIGQSNTKIIDY